MSSKRRVIPPDGYKVIFRPYQTLPDGSILHAWQRNKRAFVFFVKKDEEDQ